MNGSFISSAIAALRLRLRSLLSKASINVTRAHVDCHVTLNITTDGPVDVTLTDCNRTVHAG